jgi:hypothetical protein
MAGKPSFTKHMGLVAEAWKGEATESEIGGLSKNGAQTALRRWEDSGATVERGLHDKRGEFDRYHLSGEDRGILGSMVALSAVLTAVMTLAESADEVAVFLATFVESFGFLGLGNYLVTSGVLAGVASVISAGFEASARFMNVPHIPYGLDDEKKVFLTNAGAPGVTAIGWGIKQVGALRQGYIDVIREPAQQTAVPQIAAPIDSDTQ